MDKFVRERCCTSFAEVKEARENGADRVELCEDLSCGGVTPSADLVRECCALPIKVHVLVRARGGDFVYTSEELETMKESIRQSLEAGAAGVVIGALTAEGDVDIPAMKALMEVAHNSNRKTSVTFHRAFDCCRDQFSALEDIVALGCDRILTSGGEPSALEGKERLAQLVTSSGGRIIILAAGAVDEAQLEILSKETGAVEFHGTRLCRANR